MAAHGGSGDLAKGRFCTFPSRESEGLAGGPRRGAPGDQLYRGVSRLFHTGKGKRFKHSHFALFVKTSRGEFCKSVKLLRFIQEKEYRRLGESRTRRANVRFIAATNADLLAAVKMGHFREDLFFRLRVIPIEVPALWKRPEDICPLVQEYTQHDAELYNLPAITLTEVAWERMKTYMWPGNVRELENCIQYLTCLQLDHPVATDDLPLLNMEELEKSPPMTATSAHLSFQQTKNELVNLFEREYLEEALRRSNGNIAEAVRASGKARRAFFELMRKHGVQAVSLAQAARSA